MRILDLYLESKRMLQEANLKQLYTKSVNETPKIAQRGQDLFRRVRYFGLSKDGTLNFKIASQSVPGGFYYAYIEAPDILRLGDIIDEGDHLNEADFQRLLTMNGFRIHCNDPSYLYWSFQYMATRGNYEIEPETRAPKRNNTLLHGALCKHLVAVVKNLYENRDMRAQIIKDIENYLRMISGLEYEDYQQLNHARQIQQQNRAVKWKNKPSDYMNDYFARKAKNHQFLDDHDIKKSLKKEMNKFIKSDPSATVDDFLRSYFQMTQKAFADDMKIPEESVIEYFDELGFTKKKEEVEDLNRRKEEVKQYVLNKGTGVQSNILTKDSEQLHEYVNAYHVTEDELNKNPCYISTHFKHPETGETIHHRTDFDNISAVFKYIRDCGGFKQFTDHGQIKYAICSDYKDGEFYYVRNSLALGGWNWIDCNGVSVKYKDNKRLQKMHLDESEQIIKTLYHCSNSVITKFDDKHFESNSLGGTTYGDAIYFCDDIEHVKVYSSSKRRYIYECKVTCNNVISAKEYIRILSDEEIKRNHDGTVWNHSERRKIMLDNNVDAVDDLPSEFVVFNLDCIKDIKLIETLKESDEKSYLTPAEAHKQYQEYLEGHIGNVIQATDLIIRCCDDNEFIQEEAETLRNIARDHDKSKYEEAEFMPYLHHFYPTRPEDEFLSEEFETACRHHIRNNKHHWDFWLDQETLELPEIKDEREYKLYCVERVADWLSMAAQHQEDKSIWYESNREAIKMPAWAFEFIDSIYDKLPDDYYLNLSYKGTRGKLDEGDEL